MVCDYLLCALAAGIPLSFVLGIIVGICLWNAVSPNAVNPNAVNPSTVNDNAVNRNAVNHDAVNHDAENHDAVNHDAGNHDAVNHDDAGRLPPLPPPPGQQPGSVWHVQNSTCYHDGAFVEALEGGGFALTCGSFQPCRFNVTRLTLCTFCNTSRVHANGVAVRRRARGNA